MQFPRPLKIREARDLFALHRNYSWQILIFAGQILTQPGTIGLVVTQTITQSRLYRAKNMRF